MPSKPGVPRHNCRARQMFQAFRLPIVLDDDFDPVHAKFNREFHTMNTKYHTIALFLQPICRKLTISRAANVNFLKFTGCARQWRQNRSIYGGFEVALSLQRTFHWRAGRRGMVGRVGDILGQTSAQRSCNRNSLSFQSRRLSGGCPRT